MHAIRYYRFVKFFQKETRPLQQAAIASAVFIVAAALLLSMQGPVTSSQVASAIESVQEAGAPKPVLKDYIEITSSCDPYYGGACVNIRSGPGTEYPAVGKARTGMVLQIAEKVMNGEGEWYKITFDEWLRYPERQSGPRFIAAAYVRAFSDIGSIELTASTTPTEKRVIVDRSDQKLYAYDGDTPFMEEPTSTGLDDTPTPRGIFHVYRKTPSRYMQGPIPGISEQEYDLPGVPWNLYFSAEGAVIHGAYWHDNFGQQWSHGCVNLAPEKAKQLYEWADVGMTVTVRD